MKKIVNDHPATKSDLNAFGSKIGFQIADEVEKSEERTESKFKIRFDKIMTILDKIMGELATIRENSQIQSDDHKRLVDVEVKVENLERRVFA